jgi:large subunit ribosomal protein L29
MKVGEFRDLDVAELHQREKEMDDQLFRLRIQKSMGQLEAAHKLKALRRDLARVKTVLSEKEPGAGRQAARVKGEA